MNSLCITMLMNVENKYGKKSKEATTLKLYIISFENKKKYTLNDVIAKYREIMDKKKKKKKGLTNSQPYDIIKKKEKEN